MLNPKQWEIRFPFLSLSLSENVWQGGEAFVYKV